MASARRSAPSDLRFDVDETIELVRQRFGADFDPGIAVRLHEMADGWPLGIQLVLAVMAADRDPRAAAEALLRQKGPLHHRFVALLLANLDPADLAFLTSVSILDDFNPALAAAVTGAPDAAERLRRIAAATPVLVAGEQSDWMRLHALARDALRERFGELAGRRAVRRSTPAPRNGCRPTAWWPLPRGTPWRRGGATGPASWRSGASTTR